MKHTKQETTTLFYGDFENGQDLLSFDSEEAAHLFVLRVSKDTEITVTNGRGCTAQAQVISADKRRAQARFIPSSFKSHPSPRTRLAIGYLKGRDLEEVVDLCSQLDLLSIDILHSDYSQSSRKDDPSALLRRMEQRSLVGLKQARKAWMTQIRGPFELSEYVQSNGAQNLLLDFDGVWPPQGLESGERVLYCGPEGGFSPAEIDLIRSQPKAQSLYLGETRLRARTAPLYALGMLSGVELQR